MPHIRLKLKQNKLSDVWDIKRWNNEKWSGNLDFTGFPIFMSLKCQ